VRVALRVRKCQCQAKPQPGDRFELDDASYVVDAAEDFSAVEWIAYVCP
jgi:hypothetical protein